jgi:hypothetical protein
MKKSNEECWMTGRSELKENHTNKEKKRRVLGVPVEPEENEKLLIVLATDWRKRRFKPRRGDSSK